MWQSTSVFSTEISLIVPSFFLDTAFPFFRKSFFFMFHKAFIPPSKSLFQWYGLMKIKNTSKARLALRMLLNSVWWEVIFYWEKCSNYGSLACVTRYLYLSLAENLLKKKKKTRKLLLSFFCSLPLFFNALIYIIFEQFASTSCELQFPAC